MLGFPIFIQLKTVRIFNGTIQCFSPNENRTFNILVYTYVCLYIQMH